MGNNKTKLKRPPTITETEYFEIETKIISLTELFEEFDDNNDGMISKKELEEMLLYNKSINLTHTEFNLVMKQIDKNGDGEISKKEFLHEDVQVGK